MELADVVFAPEQINEALLWEAVKHYRARCARARTRPRAAPRLPVPAKSCGSRRHGPRAYRFSALALWRHGYTVHGPQPRSYEYAFPRKKLLGALRSALASKLADGKLTWWTRSRSRRQDQALSRRARQAGRQAHRAAG